MAFFNDFKDVFNKAAQSVSSKTKESVEITRLSGESRSTANELSTIYEQIGRIYVESRGADQQSMASLGARAEELREKLEELERQKMQIKNQNRCPACGAVMGKNARFCSNCGRRMPEPMPDPEPAPQPETEYCPGCGAMRKGADKFCEVCGHCFEAVEEPAAEVPAESIPVDDSADEAPTDFEAD